MVRHFMVGRHPKLKGLRIGKVQPLGMVGGVDVFLSSSMCSPKVVVPSEAGPKHCKDSTRLSASSRNVASGPNMGITPKRPNMGFSALDSSEGDPFADLGDPFADLFG